MHYRNFGHTDLRVSETGFGAWAMGGGAMIGSTAIGWGETNDLLSREAVFAALDAGINFFDTADIYGLGHSEELLGQWIGRRKDIIIATKGGNVAREAQFTTDYSKKHILQACEDSLRRLQRETIDFYQLHTARLPQLQQGECIEAVQELQKAGKIRYWGLSLNTFEPAPEAQYLMERGLGHGFQLVFNLLNQQSLPLIRLAAEKGYGLIARMPLQFGLLSGKFDKETRFPVNDHRSKRLVPEIIEAATAALEKAWPLCEQYQCTSTGLALRFILSFPEISVTIPGIRTAQQVADNTRDQFLLKPEDRDYLVKLGEERFRPVLEMMRERG